MDFLTLPSHLDRGDQVKEAMPLLLEQFLQRQWALTGQARWSTVAEVTA